MSFGDVQSLVALVIFIITYTAIALRNVRGFRMPIWLILLLGAAAMVLSGSIGVAAAYSAINLKVIVFLFSMFVLVSALDISGGLEDFAGALIKRAKKPEQIIYLTFTGFALLSSILMNDTIALMGTPIMISVARKLKISVKPLLLTLAFAISTGSVLTPMGNPQNLLVAIASGTSDPVLQFALYLAIPTVLNIIVMMVVLRFLFAKDVSAATSQPRGSAVQRVEAQDTQTPREHSPRDSRDGVLRTKSVAVVFLTMVGIVLVNVVGVGGVTTPFGISEVSLFGAALLLGISGRSREILEKLDWGILVMFASLFVLMQAVSDNGIISILGSVLPALSPGSARGATLAIIVSSVLLSQVLSNVPMVALYIPLMKSLGFGPADSYAWAALAGGSTLAGNLTLLGAASNLIICEEAERHGYRIGFLEFLKVGVVVTALEVGILYLYMYLVL